MIFDYARVNTEE
ncbi:Protein of unknown function [Bacillus cytotoxicus]|uniref:Uncharacterized protein n=1 Tax=Bacillus cytotoxicus TaxID=580165 RepID=A0AAX2CD59_9BACI|nr:Protein of unknown function [Bacillus cytotoxicus]